MPCPFLLPALALAFALYLALVRDISILTEWLLIPATIALFLTVLAHEKWPRNHRIAILLPITIALSFGTLGLLGGEI